MNGRGVVNDTQRLKQRLTSFKDWTSPTNCFPLALAGFRYTGEVDRVMCDYCNKKVVQWTVNDDPIEVHSRFAPDCIFLKHLGYSPRQRLPRYPRFSDYQARFESVHTVPAEFNPTLPDLESIAKAGFFYQGTLDRMTCYCCGLILRDWAVNTDAMSIHKRFRPDCNYIIRYIERSAGSMGGLNEQDERAMTILDYNVEYSCCRNIADSITESGGIWPASEPLAVDTVAENHTNIEYDGIVETREVADSSILTIQPVRVVTVSTAGQFEFFHTQNNNDLDVDSSIQHSFFDTYVPNIWNGLLVTARGKVNSLLEGLRLHIFSTETVKRLYFFLKKQIEMFCHYQDRSCYTLPRYMEVNSSSYLEEDSQVDTDDIEAREQHFSDLNVSVNHGCFIDCVSMRQPTEAIFGFLMYQSLPSVSARGGPVTMFMNTRKRNVSTTLTPEPQHFSDLEYLQGTDDFNRELTYPVKLRMPYSLPSSNEIERIRCDEQHATSGALTPTATGKQKTTIISVTVSYNDVS